MALTNEELESMLNALTDRLEALETKVGNCITTAQSNAITLVLEKDISDLKSDMTTTKNRVSTLEGRVNDLV